MKISSYSSFLLITVLILAPFNAISEEAEVWTIASLNWEPYSGASLVDYGSSIVTLAELLKTKNIDLVVKFYPWKRAVAMSHSKEFVGYYPSWPEDVLEGFVASPTIAWSEHAIIQAYDEELSFSSIDQLFERYKVGIVRDYTYPASIEAAIQKYPHNVESVTNELSLLKMLAAKRTDVVISDPLVMEFTAAKTGASINIIVNQVITKKELVLGFRIGEDNIKRIKLLQELLASSAPPVE